MLISNKKIKFITENIDNRNRLAQILDNLHINYQEEKQSRLYVIIYDYNEEMTNINIEDKEILKSVLRGAFMASGYINEPNSKYHLEMIFKNKQNAKFINYITEQFDVNTKIVKKNTNYDIYLKDGEAISNFLALIGANKAVLNFEQIRVMRDIKNNVNRVVNCETANLNKIIDVAIEQINDINYIKERGKYNELPNTLKEIADIRLENTDMSLADMGKLLEKPISKSGVNHRLKKIHSIANELRNERS